MIEALAEGLQPDRQLYHDFHIARRGAEAGSQFARSGRFALTAVGDVNLYALFAELALHGMGRTGRSGIIVPTGIATDNSTKDYFAFITGKRCLASLYDFENREGIFSGVHRSYKFTLLTLGHDVPQSELLFFATRVEHLKDPRRRFHLTPGEFELLNPNTRTCPVFRSNKDAELTKKIYTNNPVLISDHKGERNPWGITIKTRHFHMAEDSHLLMDWDSAIKLGAQLTGNIFKIGERRLLPLYEAKMIHHCDHRWSTFDRTTQAFRDLTMKEKQEPSAVPLPRYWVEEWEVVLRTTDAPNAVLKPWRKGEQEAVVTALKQWVFWSAKVLGHPSFGKLCDALQDESAAAAGNDLFAEDIFSDAECLYEESGLTGKQVSALADIVINHDKVSLLEAGRLVLKERCPSYLLGWRDICRSTDERTIISSAIPFCSSSNTLPLLFSEQPIDVVSALVANLNSIVLDYVGRQKIGGTHLTFGYLKQFPILKPGSFSSESLDYINQRILELVYTAEDMAALAKGLGYSGKPFKFDLDRRHQLKCELDAYFAQLYGLTRDELRYILDPADVMGEDYPSETFRGLKNKEIKEFGEYRTQRLVLEAYDQLARQRFALETRGPIAPGPLREVVAGGWASPPTENPEIRAMQVLASVLQAWNEKVPANKAQLAAVLIENPRLVTAQLSYGQDQWLHAVGEQAELIDQHALSTLPRPDYAWGNAFREMVARGWLIEEEDTWRLGRSVPPELFVEWGLGRAGIVKTLVENRGEELGDDLQDEIREVWSGVAA